MRASVPRILIVPRIPFVALVTVIVFVMGGCKQETPKTQQPAQPQATPDVAAAGPAKVAIDLDAVQQSLAAPTDAKAALNALRELGEALATPGTLPPEQESRARELRLAGGFALLAGAAVGQVDVDARDVSLALGLEGSDEGVQPALASYAQSVGLETATGKAAQVVAWLVASPDQRAQLPAPDVDTWLSLVRDDAPAGVAVRAATLDALEDVLKRSQDQAETPTPEGLAGALGPILCAGCAAVPTATAEALPGLLYDPANRGYVCAPAAEKLQGAAPYAYPDAVAGACQPSDYGLSQAEEMKVLTAGNALTLRALAALVAAQQAPKDDKNPLAAMLQSEIAVTKAAADALAVPLALPWLPVPLDAQADRAATVVPPAHVAPAGTRRPQPPLETVVVDEAGVSIALRPVASIRQGSVVLEDRAAGYAFPGRQVIAADGVDASDQKRQETAKASGEEIADKDVIAEVEDGIRQLSQQAAPIAERALRGAPEALRNASREDDARTALLTVDTAAPAWLFRRTLASLRAAGYRYPLVQRANPADLRGEQVLAIVFRSADDLPATVTDKRFERPILVAVGDDSVEIYPPTGRIEAEKKDDAAAPSEPAPAEPGKEEGAEQAQPLSWPEGAETVLDPKKRLFAIKIELPEGGQAVGATVTQAFQKLAQDEQAGNVVYVIADKKATAGRVLEVVDALSTAPGESLQGLAAIEPGLECEAAACPTHVVVLFPDVRRPKMRVATTAPAPKPKPKRDEGNARGPAGFCSKGNIKSVVTRRSGSFRFCYEKELQLHPDLKGRLTVQFTIGRDGTVPKAVITQSTIGNRRVEQCVIKTFRMMRFDKPQGGICVVSWPLKFQ